MNDMALNVAIEIISAAVLLVIIVSQYASKIWHSKASRYFLAVLWLLFATLAVDMVAWLVDEKPGTLYLVLACATNFIGYTTSILVNFFFVLYIGESIPLSGRSKIIAYCVASVATVFFIVLIIANQFNGVMYYIDANNLFHWGPLYAVPHLTVNVLYLLILWAVFINRKKLGRYAALSYASYAVIPLLADWVNIYFYQVTIGYPAMVIALLIVFVNIQMQREQQMREQEIMLQNQEMALKMSQIKPHFVFNTLTAIKTLYRNDPELAAETLTNFSAHLRTMIDTPKMPDLIYFRDELHNAYTYLSVEQQRFKNRFEVEYDIGERFFYVPPLTLQPIVENAVLHGLTVGEGGTKLVIKTCETPDDYVIAVMDDGNGFDPSASFSEDRSHVGIENVRSRLETLCGGRLTVDSRPGEGTTVTMTIPKGGGAG